MNMLLRCMLFASLFWIGISVNVPRVSRTKTNDETKKILSKITDPVAYDKDIPPQSGDAGPVNVSITVFLRSFNFDEKNMKMTTDLTFRMGWTDSRLDYSNTPGVPYITLIDTDLIWLPDAFFKESYSTTRLISVLPEAYARINATAYVIYSARYILKTHCPMDLQRFPHDRQECHIRIGSYGYTMDHLKINDIEYDDVQVAQGLYSNASNAFVFYDHRTANCYKGSTTLTGQYSCVEIILILDRLTSSYITQWYVPIAIFVLISFFSHLITSDKLLPRIILTLGPLLTLAAASISYSSTLARVGYSTALDVYTGISILVIFLTLLHVCVTYYFSSKTKENEEGLIIREESKLKKLLREKGDFIGRVLIIGFYVIFILLYILAYSHKA